MLAMDTIGSRLREARKARGLSQEELAKRAGVGQSAVGNIESGRSNGAETLHKFAAVLGYRLRWLEVGDGPREGAGPAKSPPLAAVLTELARSIAARPRIDRIQLAALLPLLASDPDTRDETCKAIMKSLAPEVNYTYTATWEETARDVARFVGDSAKLTPGEFLDAIDQAHAKSVKTGALPMLKTG